MKKSRDFKTTRQIIFNKVYKLASNQDNLEIINSRFRGHFIKDVYSENYPIIYNSSKSPLAFFVNDKFIQSENNITYFNFPDTYSFYLSRVDHFIKNKIFDNDKFEVTVDFSNTLFAFESCFEKNMNHLLM